MCRGFQISSGVPPIGQTHEQPLPTTSTGRYPYEHTQGIREVWGHRPHAGGGEPGTRIDATHTSHMPCGLGDCTRARTLNSREERHHTHTAINQATPPCGDAARDRHPPKRNGLLIRMISMIAWIALQLLNFASRRHVRKCTATNRKQNNTIISGCVERWA